MAAKFGGLIQSVAASWPHTNRLTRDDAEVPERLQRPTRNGPPRVHRMIERQTRAAADKPELAATDAEITRFH